jgi:hypothetical protein
MLNIKLSVAAVALAAAAALTACGGDDGGGFAGNNGTGSNTGTGNGASGGIPASALASVDGLMAFMNDLIANRTDETSEPIDLGTSALPTDDTKDVIS